MDDGNLVPGDHDGMACFQGRGPTYVLIRNHELSPSEDEEGNNLGCLAENGQQYDPFIGTAAGLGGGGTTNVVVDKRDGSVVEHFVSLGGTIRNCAGGLTPWDSWISCEENVDTPDNDDEVTLRHGYNFEVPAALSGAVEPIALTAMGRFNHEAVAVDPRTHYVYQTEDRRDSIFFKYEPARRPTGFGDLQDNDGKLFAMVIEPGQFADCDPGIELPLNVFDPNFPELPGGSFVDTRGNLPIGRSNVVEGSGESILPFLGQELKVSWVELDDVDPVEDSLRYEALAKGAAVWFRGEGAWEHKGLIYWVCSGAGDAGEGQIWVYDSKKETVKLVIESTEENLLDGPDKHHRGWRRHPLSLRGRHRQFRRSHGAELQPAGDRRRCQRRALRVRQKHPGER